MMSRDAMRAIDRAAATYAASQSDPIGAYRAYLAGALEALRQVRSDLLSMPQERSLTMHTITPTVTDEQIRALRVEAAAAGDRAQVNICDRALGRPVDGDAARLSRDEARAECARVIADARARQD